MYSSWLKVTNKDNAAIFVNLYIILASLPAFKTCSCRLDWHMTKNDDALLKISHFSGPFQLMTIDVCTKFFRIQNSFINWNITTWFSLIYHFPLRFDFKKIRCQLVFFLKALRNFFGQEQYWQELNIQTFKQKMFFKNKTALLILL